MILITYNVTISNNYRISWMGMEYHANFSKSRMSLQHQCRGKEDQYHHNLWTELGCSWMDLHHHPNQSNSRTCLCTCHHQYHPSSQTGLGRSWTDHHHQHSHSKQSHTPLMSLQDAQPSQPLKFTTTQIECSVSHNISNLIDALIDSSCCFLSLSY